MGLESGSPSSSIQPYPDQNAAKITHGGILTLIMHELSTTSPPALTLRNEDNPCLIREKKDRPPHEEVAKRLEIL